MWEHDAQDLIDAPGVFGTAVSLFCPVTVKQKMSFVKHTAETEVEKLKAASS